MTEFRETTRQNELGQSFDNKWRLVNCYRSNKRFVFGLEISPEAKRPLALVCAAEEQGRKANGGVPWLGHCVHLTQNFQKGKGVTPPRLRANVRSINIDQEKK